MASHYYGRVMLADGGAPGPSPYPISVANPNSLPAFLVKTYNIVEDPTTDKIISWSANANSFIVWNPPELERDILPNFFKHKNFTSFVRQLNTYGFRKVDPDRWEFANDGFLRGRKDLLKNINRQKQNQQQRNVQSSSAVGACVEVGKFGLEEEVEQLKRDKNVLMQEVVRMRQRQQSTDAQLQEVVLTVHGMEQRQQQMLLFLVNAVNSPGLLSQFVQLQSDHNKLIAEGSKKRRFKKDAANVVPVDGQVVKYQPRMNEAALAMVRQFLEVDSSPISGNFPDDFLANSSVPMMNSYSPANHISELTLQEAPLSSRQPFMAPVSSAAFQSRSPSLISEAQMHGKQDVLPLAIPPSVIDIPRLPQLQSNPSNSRCDTSRDGNSPLEIDEEEINWDDLFTDSEGLPGSVDPFWDPVFMDSLQKMSEDMDTNPGEEFCSTGTGVISTENGWNGNNEHIWIS